MSNAEKKANAMEEMAMINDYIMAAKKTKYLIEENPGHSLDEIIEGMYGRGAELLKVVVSCD